MRMHLSGRQRFYNFHGLPCARLEGDTSVYGRLTYHRTWFIKALSPFLWYAPDAHLFNLQKLCGDGIVGVRAHEQLVQKMNEEWQEFVLFVSARNAFSVDEVKFMTGDSVTQRKCCIPGNSVCR